jgi:hypothetical protein
MVAEGRGVARPRPPQMQLGQHAVLPLSRYSYVVTRSRPYPLHRINSVLHSVLNAVIYPVLSRLALTLQMCLNARESESVLVARVGLPRGRSDAASSF